MAGIISGVFTYVKSLFHTIKKEDVVKTLDFVFNNISQDVLPTLTDVIENADIKLIENSKILKNLSTFADMRAKNNKEFLVKLKAIFEDFSSNYKLFATTVDNELNDIVTNSATTPKDSAILKIINDIGAMNIFILDLLYIIIMDKENSVLPSIKVKTVEANIPDFAQSLKFYSKDFEKIIKDIPKLSDTIMNINDGKESMLSGVLQHIGLLTLLPQTNGFINNPIYHIRMWMVDREVAKYESLKDRKKMIELRLLELKLEDKGESDAALQKQIQYYEEKINKLEYEIAKLEK